MEPPAERGGFEPPVRFLARMFSKHVVSATHPPLRGNSVLAINGPSIHYRLSFKAETVSALPTGQAGTLPLFVVFLKKECKYKIYIEKIRWRC